MVTKFRGNFVTNNGHCQLFMLTGTLMAIDSSIAPVTMNHAANSNF